MKKFLLSFLVLILFVPNISQARSKLLYERIALRRQKRLNQLEQQVREQQFLRVQRQIVPRETSVRRIRGYRGVELLGVYNAAIILVRYWDGSIREVRLLGIDAPEILPQPRQPECYALESREALRRQLQGGEISLQKEEEYHYDSYNRMVRYVRIDRRDVGSWLLRNGYAFADTDHDHSKLELYEEIEADAKEDEIGLWSSACDYQEVEDYRLDID